MEKLAAAKVCRSGRTARVWNEETEEVSLGKERNALCLRFSLSSKGGGVTDVKLTIGPEDFAAMASAMANADRQRAMCAMTASLASELTKQVEYEKEILREGRNSVVEAAERAYRDAPEGHDHAERLTLDIVRQLVDDLDNLDDSESDESEEP